jgi:hypothetical protein
VGRRSVRAPSIEHQFEEEDSRGLISLYLESRLTFSGTSSPYAAFVVDLKLFCAETIKEFMPYGTVVEDINALSDVRRIDVTAWIYVLLYTFFLPDAKE